MKLSDEIRQHMAESEENRLALWDRIAALYERLEAVEKIASEIEAYLDSIDRFTVINKTEFLIWIDRLRGEK